jgi:hypothetical protein
MTRIHHQTTAEPTVVVTVDWLESYGRDWLRFPAANVVTIGSHLDAAGHERALTEAGGHAMTTPSTSPCPGWCQYGPHSATDDGTVVHEHARLFGEYVSVCVDEEVSPDGPTLSMSAPFLFVADDVGQLSLADAQPFAA